MSLNKLYEWSDREYGHLPWRQKRTLYRTLVSEIMLQQTTVSTVLNHFERFLKVFPTVKKLASATEEEVCAQWQGLGYYRRARNLRKAAVAIVENFGGKFPTSYEDLISIPGIGDYTANALIAIGRDEDALALDANLERVFSRYYGIEKEKGPKLIKEVKSIEDKIFKDFKVKESGARVLNEALMDLGRVYCQARKADCLLCPLKKKCYVVKEGKDPLGLPIAKPKKEKDKQVDLHLLRVVVKKGDKILGYTKDESEWLSGQLEIPTFIISSDDKKLKQYPWLKKFDLSKFKEEKIKTAITKYKITNSIIVLSLKEFSEYLLKENSLSNKYQYVKLDIENNHFSTTTLKSLRKISVI